MRKFKDWRTNSHERWIDAANVFGSQLFTYAREEQMSNLAEDLTTRERTIAVEAINNTLYAVLMMLDGVVDLKVDANHSTEYSLMQRVFDDQSRLVSEIELTPNGDGLCMGFHGWKSNEFS